MVGVLSASKPGDRKRVQGEKSAHHHGRRKEEQGTFPLSFKIWHIPIKFLEKKSRFPSFVWINQNFTIFGLPVEKSLDTPGKIHCWPLWKKSLRRPCLPHVYSFTWYWLYLYEILLLVFRVLQLQSMWNLTVLFFSYRHKHTQEKRLEIWGHLLVSPYRAWKSACLVSWNQMSQNNKYKAGVCPSSFVLAVPLLAKFHSSANFREILRVGQRYLRMFCRPLESMRLGSSWKPLGNAAGVRCWRPPLSGRQIIVFLLRSLCPCRRSYITTVHCGC